MAKILDKMLSCPVCGKEEKYAVVCSFSVRESGLDGKPDADEFTDFVLECPYCGYAFSDPRKPASEAVKKLVYSGEYRQSRLQQTDATLRRLESAALLCQADGDPQQAAEYCLKAAWYCEMSDRLADAPEYRKRYLSIIENTPGLSLMPGQVPAYLDSLRQTGQFQRAIQGVHYYMEALRCPTDQTPAAQELFRVILQYAARGDAAPHFLGEKPE